MIATFLALATIGHASVTADFAPSVWRVKGGERHLFFTSEGTFHATTCTKEGYRGIGSGTFDVKGGVITIKTTIRIFRDGKEKGADKLSPAKESQLAYKGSSISAGATVYERIKTRGNIGGYKDHEGNRVTFYDKSFQWDLSMKPKGIFKTFMGHQKANAEFVEMIPILDGDPTVFTPEGNNMDESQFATWVTGKGIQLRMIGYVDEDSAFQLVCGPYVPAAPPVYEYAKLGI